jgi:flavin reductase (DIM6/NTAB) family NADH-FMN oxidoreductase RutF
MDADARKTTLRMIPYGLYLLTSVNGDTVGAGTVNWVSQMAFDPPLLAIGVKDGTASLANIKAGGSFALSFLGTGQGDLAFAFFADAPLEGDEFVTKDARVPVERAPSGAPVLTDAPAWADLSLVEIVEKGDHAVVVAEVTDVGLRQESPEVLTLKELGLNYGG